MIIIFLSGFFDELQIDEDGNPICIICDEKLKNEREWAEHVEIERSKLIKNINQLKEQKSNYNCIANSSGDHNRRKREFELMRIRANQQKRLAAKNMPNREIKSWNISTTSSDGPSSCSAIINKSDETDGSINTGNYCKSCERYHEYLIISNAFEEARCQECFFKFRAQTGALPLTITTLPTERASSVSHCETEDKHSPQSALALIVENKRPRFD
ncbi:unnamed protein product [Dracunculus medinensis]|uniref:Uncharacterized protein n=1 Tax=Dracunculus medinensis TaxID=318479 RepID=A0A0N4UK57_DRAME|nr:unnamed protein product [Dracunculus medinensis]